jgi:hypothetical protein
MNKAARSVLYFGIYLIVLGATLVIVPGPLLALFGFPPATDIWIRVVGVLVLAIASYYVQAGRNDLRAFFPFTVYARVFVFLSLAAFAILQLARPALALFGSVDLLGAIWTGAALRRTA